MKFFIPIVVLIFCSVSIERAFGAPVTVKGQQRIDGSLHIYLEGFEADAICRTNFYPGTFFGWISSWAGGIEACSERLQKGAYNKQVFFDTLGLYERRVTKYQQTLSILESIKDLYIQDEVYKYVKHHFFGLLSGGGTYAMYVQAIAGQQYDLDFVEMCQSRTLLGAVKGGATGASRTLNAPYIAACLKAVGNLPKMNVLKKQYILKICGSGFIAQLATENITLQDRLNCLSENLDLN